MRRLNLCFHGIGTPGDGIPSEEAAYWVSTDTFRRVLDLAVGPGRDVRVSFDDGCSSDVAIALPELQERGLTASFFPLAGRLDAAGSLSGDDLEALQKAGMTIGSHGMRHVPWRGLDDRDLHEELVEARAVLEDAVGAPVTQAACPLGRYDRRVLARLRSLGYDTVWTSDRAVARSGAWVQPRFSVRASDDAQSVADELAAHARRGTRAKDAARIALKRLR